MSQQTILELLNEKKQGVSVLCKHFGVTRGTIYQSINGYGSREIRVGIALILDLKPSLLWSGNDVKSLQLDDALFTHKKQTNENLEHIKTMLKQADVSVCNG